MFGLGMPEILLILAIALIVIGPKKLPDLAKTLGRAMGEFKRSAQDFKRSIDIDTTVTDVKDVDPPEEKNKLKEAVEAANKEAADPTPFTRKTSQADTESESADQQNDGDDSPETATEEPPDHPYSTEKDN